MYLYTHTSLVKRKIEKDTYYAGWFLSSQHKPRHIWEDETLRKCLHNTGKEASLWSKFLD